MGNFSLEYRRGSTRLAGLALAELPDATTFFARTAIWRAEGVDASGRTFGDVIELYEGGVACDGFGYEWSPYGWVAQDVDPGERLRFCVHLEREGYPPHREWTRATTLEDARTWAARFVEELAEPLANDQARVSLEDRETGAWAWVAGPLGVPLADLAIDAPRSLTVGDAVPVAVTWRPPVTAEAAAVDLVLLGPGARVSPASVRIDLPRETHVRHTFAVTPLRPGALLLVAELLIRGDPIDRYEHCAEVKP